MNVFRRLFFCRGSHRWLHGKTERPYDVEDICMTCKTTTTWPGWHEPRPVVKVL